MTESGTKQSERKIASGSKEQLRQFLEAAFAHLREGESFAFKPFKGSKPQKPFRFLPTEIDSAVENVIRDAGKASISSVYVHVNAILATEALGDSGFVKTEHIARRIHIVIDTDPVRFGPDGRELVTEMAYGRGEVKTAKVKCNATDAEKAEAVALAKHVREVLTRYGFPSPVIVGDSGNGWHTWYALDLPVNDETDDLLSGFLNALEREQGGRFAAHVDLSMFDPPRIARVVSTPNRKYDEQPDRPVRMASLIEINNREPVPIELIRRFVAEHPDSEPEIPLQRNSKTPPDGYMRAGDAYNAGCGPADDAILDDLPAGSKVYRRFDGWLQITRPGKTTGTSATWGYCKKDGKPLLRVFSDDFAPFEVHGVYDRFGCYARTHHGKNFQAARQALAAKGYGTQGATARITFNGEPIQTTGPVEPTPQITPTVGMNRVHHPPESNGKPELPNQSTTEQPGPDDSIPNAESEAEPDLEDTDPPPKPDLTLGPYDLGNGYTVQFRHSPRGMTEVFLFRNKMEADSDKLDIRNARKRDDLVERWTSRHPGIKRHWLVAALRSFSFVERPNKQQSAADSDDERLEVELTNDERQDRTSVLPVLAVDPRLFVRDGILVYPRVHEAPAAPVRKENDRSLTWKRAEGSTALVPAPVPFVRKRITDQCRLVRPGTGASPCPDYLPSSIHADPEGIRIVQGLALGPILRPDGSLLNVPGFDEQSGLYLAGPVPGLENLIPETVSLAAAQQAIRSHWDPLLKDFPWKGKDEDQRRTQRSKFFALLFTGLLRHVLKQVPFGLITANNAGSGKTYLCRIIGVVAHGFDPMTLTWPEGSKLQNRGDEVRKKLASLLHESATLALIDNLPRGEWFQSPELDAFLTASTFFDRQLHRNDGARVGGAQRCQLLGTGNNIIPSGDTADRTLHLELETNHPNPRSRPVTTFGVGEATDHAHNKRAELLAAALTCIRGWIQAGHPCPPGESWGSFSEWTQAVGGIVRWLMPGVDPIKGRAGAATTDPETQSLASLIVTWEILLGPEFVTAGRIVREIEDRDDDGERRKLTAPQEAFREAVCAVCGAGNVPGAIRLGHALGGYVGKRVPISREGNEIRLGWLESDDDNNLKQKRYRVQTKVESKE